MAKTKPGDNPMPTKPISGKESTPETESPRFVQQMTQFTIQIDLQETPSLK